MIYKLIGLLVVKGVKAFLRQRYGPTYAPKPVVAGGVLVAALGVLLIFNKREST